MQDHITDYEAAIAEIARHKLMCAQGIEVAEPQPGRPVSSIGGTFYGQPGESWPVSDSGAPLIPWLQIVCEEIPQREHVFPQKALVTFFLDEEGSSFEITTWDREDGFVVREYEIGERLRPLPRPHALKGHPFSRIRWKWIADYPPLSRFYEFFSNPVYEKICAQENLPTQNLSGIKIGGWPTPIQCEKEPGDWNLQIDMTENFMYGDSGIAYLSRSDKGWYAMFECC